MRFLRRRNPVDQYAPSRERTQCLAETLVHPTRYLQRFVDQMAFLPQGGQRWRRTLQVRIPEAAPAGRSWHIVSLGQYERRRFPDLVATDASDARLNLLTRHQHGIALTRVTLAKHVYSLPRANYIQLKAEAGQPAYSDFRTELYNFYTTAGDIIDPESTVRQITRGYRRVLRYAGISPNDGESRIKELADDLTQAASATRYLCWIEAEPNEVVSIRILYTVKDPIQELERTSIRGSFIKIINGIFARKTAKRQAIWADWYRQFGIAPLNYAFDIPGRHTASYYFAIDPPVASDVTYLDWEVSNSLEDQEIDSAYFSGHVHNGDESELTSLARDVTVRAFIRCAPHHHKQILGVTLINCALVYLLAKGLLLGKLANSAQGALLAAPPVLIAYLVQQQRHYYAHTIRRQRAILWIYLAISVGFLLAVAFSHKELDHQNPERFTEVIALLLAASSVGVFIWYLPLGYSYQNVVASFAQRKLRKLGEKLEKSVMQYPSPITKLMTKLRRHLQVASRRRFWQSKLSAKIRRRLQIIEVPPLWECYADAVHKYCTWIFRVAIAAMVGVTVGLAVFWHSLEDHSTPTFKSVAHTTQDPVTRKPF